MQPETIVRSALGAPINLGDLYDACNETSCNLRFLKGSPPTANQDWPGTESTYVHVKSASDKFRLLNVTGELQVSLLAGMVKCSGSGEYFQAEKSSAQSVSVSFARKYTTTYESLSILDEKFREMINLDAFKHESATHVVTGIWWGANLIVTAEYKNDEKKDAQIVAGNLQGTLEKVLKGANLRGAELAFDLKSTSGTENSKFELKIVGDVLGRRGQIPQTVEGAMALVDELPELTQKYNGGKGVPVRYELTSLDSIKSYFAKYDQRFATGVQVCSLFCPLQLDTILQVTEIFDEIAEAKLMLKDFCNDVENFKAHLPEEMRDKAKTLKREAVKAETTFRNQLKTLLVAVRTGKAEVSKLDVLKKTYASGPYSAKNVDDTLTQDFGEVRLKIERLQSLVTLGVAIVPKHTQCLPSKLAEFPGKQVFILFGELKAITKASWSWYFYIQNLRKFVEDAAVTKDSAFLFVDLDSTPNLKPRERGFKQKRICLQKFDKYGRCVAFELSQIVLPPPVYYSLEAMVFPLVSLIDGFQYLGSALISPFKTKAPTPQLKDK